MGELLYLCGARIYNIAFLYSRYLCVKDTYIAQALEASEPIIPARCTLITQMVANSKYTVQLLIILTIDHTIRLRFGTRQCTKINRNTEMWLY